ncbi:MAG: hypothetical protein WA919_17130 [Coleofasciculaceae cyanobacterium]
MVFGIKGEVTLIYYGWVRFELFYYYPNVKAMAIITRRGAPTCALTYCSVADSWLSNVWAGDVWLSGI